MGSAIDSWWTMAATSVPQVPLVRRDGAARDPKKPERSAGQLL